MGGISDRDPINLHPGVNHTGGLPVWDSLSANKKKKKERKLICTSELLINVLFLNSVVSLQLGDIHLMDAPASTMSCTEEGVEGKLRFAYLMSSLSLYSSVF